MLQDLDRFDVFVKIDSYKVTLDIRNHCDGEQIRHALMVSDVRAFDIKPLDFRPLNIVSICPISAGTSQAPPRHCSMKSQ